MPITAKICGLSTPETVAAALRLGAEYIGYVFHPRSPRHLTFEQAWAINQSLGRDPSARSRGKTVGVMVDPDDEFADRAVFSGELDAIQLHGSESPERVAYLRRFTGVEIWKAIPVKTRADLDLALSYRGAANRILYDAKTPDTAALPGGMGLRFDWTLLQGHAHPLPWALSGGLNPENVAEAVRVTGATIVDVSSGVESAPGVKDVDKITAFLKAVAQC